MVVIKKKWFIKGVKRREKKKKKSMAVIRLCPEGEDEAGVNGAAMGGMVVLGLEVGLGTRRVAGMAVDSGAVVTGLAGRNVEAVLGEGRSSTVHVNGGHVPEDGVTSLGVLKLKHISLVLAGGKLDGDTTAIGVGLPGFSVGSAARREGMHVANTIGNRPRVDVGIHVVDDGDTAAAVTSDNGRLRESRGEGSKGSSNESLGEHHFD